MPKKDGHRKVEMARLTTTILINDLNLPPLLIYVH